MIVAVKASFPFHIRKIISLGPCNLQKPFLLRRIRHAVSHNPGQIRRRCGVHFSVFVHLRIQTVRGNKITVKTTDVTGLLIHHSRKLLHAAAHSLGDHHRRIVVGFQHQGIQQIPQPVFLPRLHKKLHFRHTCRIGRSLHNLIQVTIFQRENTGHNLRGAGHRQLILRILSVENPAGIRIHEDSRLGVELQFLLPILFLPAVSRRLDIQNKTALLTRRTKPLPGRRIAPRIPPHTKQGSCHSYDSYPVVYPFSILICHIFFAAHTHVPTFPFVNIYAQPVFL